MSAATGARLLFLPLCRCGSPPFPAGRTPGKNGGRRAAPSRGRRGVADDRPPPADRGERRDRSGSSRRGSRWLDEAIRKAACDPAPGRAEASSVAGAPRGGDAEMEHGRTTADPAQRQRSLRFSSLPELSGWRTRWRSDRRLRTTPEAVPTTRTGGSYAWAACEPRRRPGRMGRDPRASAAARPVSPPAGVLDPSAVLRRLHAPYESREDPCEGPERFASGWRRSPPPERSGVGIGCFLHLFQAGPAGRRAGVYSTQGGVAAGRRAGVYSAQGWNPVPRTSSSAARSRAALSWPKLSSNSDCTVRQ